MHVDVYAVAGSAQKGFDFVLGLTDSMSATIVLQMHAWFMVRWLVTKLLVHIPGASCHS
jgi:hypothetical protein